MVGRKKVQLAAEVYDRANRSEMREALSVMGKQFGSKRGTKCLGAIAVVEDGERGRNRTFNLLIKSQLLCQLSYAPKLLFSVNYGRCHFVKSGIVS